MVPQTVAECWIGSSPRIAIRGSRSSHRKYHSSPEIRLYDSAGPWKIHERQVNFVNGSWRTLIFRRVFVFELFCIWRQKWICALVGSTQHQETMRRGWTFFFNDQVDLVTQCRSNASTDRRSHSSCSNPSRLGFLLARRTIKFVWSNTTGQYDWFSFFCRSD
jgi:hypothetical protein